MSSRGSLWSAHDPATEPDAPQRFVLRARGQGAPGTVDAVVEVRLSEVEGGTRVDYDAEAVIGGMIGGVGQRMLSSVAKKTAKDFFAAVDEESEQLAVTVRAGARALPDPEPGSIFDHVYADLPADLRRQRADFVNYVASLDDEVREVTG